MASSSVPTLSPAARRASTFLLVFQACLSSLRSVEIGSGSRSTGRLLAPGISMGSGALARAFLFAASLFFLFGLGATTREG